MDTHSPTHSGNVEDFIRFILMTNSIPSLEDVNVEVVYATPGDNSLNGRCFSGVDEFGTLHVFKGHPGNLLTHSLTHSLTH